MNMAVPMGKNILKLAWNWYSLTPTTLPSKMRLGRSMVPCTTQDSILEKVQNSKVLLLSPIASYLLAKIYICITIRLKVTEEMNIF